MEFPRLRRWFPRVLLALVVLMAAGWFSLRTGWGRDRVRDFAIAKAATAVDGVLTIDRLEGSLWADAALHGVRITKGGETVLAVEHLSADYNWRDLLRGDIRFSRVEAAGLNAIVEQKPEGWVLRGIATGDSDKPGTTTVSLPSIRVTGSRLQLWPAEAPRREFTDLSFEGAVMMRDGDISVATNGLSTRETTGGLEVQRFAGVLELDKDGTRVNDFVLRTSRSAAGGTISISNADPAVMKGRVTSDGFTLEEFAPYVKALERYNLRPSFDLTWAGPERAVRVTGWMESAGSRVRTDLTANLVEGMSARGQAQFSNLDLEPVTLDRTMKSRLNGVADFDIRLVDDSALPFQGTFSGELSDASIWGYQTGRTRARGTVHRSGVTADVITAAYGAAGQASIEYTKAGGLLRAKGTAQGVDIRLMPAQANLPALASAIDGTFTMHSSGSDWALDATIASGVIEGARVDPGTTVRFESDRKLLTYHLVGRVSGLDIQRMAPIVLDEPGEYVLTTPIKITSTFDISGAGASEIRSHDAVFAYSNLEGDFDGAVVRHAHGKGTLNAGRLAMSVDGDVTGQWGRILLLPDYDLRPAGRMTGHVVVNDVAAEEMTFDVTSGNGTVTLGPSSLFGTDIDKAAVTANWGNGSVTFSEAAAYGAGVSATAHGTLAVSGPGESQLSFVLDAADISTLEKFAGAELAGVGHVEGTIVGPAAAPQVAGSLEATQLHYNTTTALGVTSTFTVALPEWDVTRIKGDVRGDAVFVGVAGQTLQRVGASAAIDGKSATLEAFFEQPDRRAQLGAQVSLDGEDRDVVVQRADLTGAGETWTLAGGAPARIRQTAGRLSVDSMRFTNGTQELVIEGVLPLEGSTTAAEALVVRASAVAVEGLTKIALGHQRITGRLNGEARVTGSLADPQVAGTFALTEGKADNVAFNSLTGSAGYKAGGATVDLKLDAGDAGSLTAVGTVPVGEAGAAAAPLNVRLSGSLTNAAVLGPAIPGIEDLAGTTDMDIVISGSLEKPLARGTAVLKDMSFRVRQLGAGYRGLNASLRFEDTLMHVDQFVVLDEDGHALRVDGSLDVLATGPSRALNLRARATQFHLMTNEYGELVVSTDLTMGGDLVSPNILGTIRVEDGRVEVDRILEEYVLARGYVPVGEVIAGPAPETATPQLLGPAAPFAGSAISIELQLPDNVQVRGRGIQTEDGTIGLGDVNITVGGLLRITKAPGSEVRLLGEVSAVRGTYDFQGRQFSIARDSVLRFRGDDMTNPSLDITAEREISGVDVSVHIRGTAAAPELTLRSQPPLEEGDILALVAFGRPISQLMDSQRADLAGRAGAIAAGALAAPLTASVGRALDLDVFEVESGAGVAGGASVMVGRRVSDKLFVGFRHQFGREGGPRLTFEYRLTEFLRIVSTISPEGEPANLTARAEGSGVDLIFVIRR